MLVDKPTVEKLKAIIKQSLNSKTAESDNIDTGVFIKYGQENCIKNVKAFKGMKKG